VTETHEPFIGPSPVPGTEFAAACPTRRHSAALGCTRPHSETLRGAKPAPQRTSLGRNRHATLYNRRVRDPSQSSPEQRGAVYLETFGCQMNELDSELVRGQLVALGYRFVESVDEAQVILFNTCSVREQAENKAYSRIGLVGKRKRAGEQIVLGVIGCMAERDGVDMIRRHPQIDLLCGPGELDRLPQLLDNAVRTGAVDVADRVALQGNSTRRSSTLSAAEDNLELLDLSRAFDPDRAAAGGRSAYVRITRGCNKFCTYCVVPNTRGAEVHRPPDHIVEECRRLADHGVIEVTLLGQTVNHYLYVHGSAVTVDGRDAPQVGPGLASVRKGASAFAGQRVTTFADLLRRIHEEVPQILRLRFVTSYPRDFGDDILQVLADSPRICRYLHVPPQSGSDRILRMMNRGYSVGEYFEFIERARTFLPDVMISGDLIVGFPTETEEDFQATVLLLERVRFKNCFIFKYSPRPGTTAIERFVDDVAEVEKRRRNNELLATQSRISSEIHAGFVGRTVDAFIERQSVREQKQRRRAGMVQLGWEGRSEGPAEVAPTTMQLTGRTAGDLIVAVDVPANDAGSLLGRVVRVEVVGSSPLLLTGRLVDDVAPTPFPFVEGVLSR